MPTVFVLIGLPGSGKTTWRREFLAVRQGGTVAVARDDVVEEMAAAADTTYRQAWQAFGKAIDKEYRRQLGEAFAGTADVVVDATNLTLRARRRILCRAPRGWHRVAVVFEAADGELARRLRSRAALGGPCIPWTRVEEMRRTMVHPAPGEFDQVVRVSGTLPSGS